MTSVGIVTLAVIGFIVFLAYITSYYVFPAFANPGVIEACYDLDYTLDTTSSVYYSCYEEFEDGSVRKIRYKLFNGEIREIRN